MAGVPALTASPTKEKAAMNQATLTASKDDIESLMKNLNLPGLQYKELTDQEDRRAILERWPLLAELAALPDKQAAT
ncbi:YhjR family protein [Paralcaligenes sp. KSB-10]|uniref:BcsR/BcsP family cellulose biosynthesis protein n=1 Tax=Paralcaligenes sp. KSB-10 TaxID=2901142 RepID=UPI001E4B0EEF|nr:BcsR/BcsP family cellulose biosynthesis protein [Paralcaligenes sp. KSB-10]UHL64437.1 YhjR family protein [Paralcaligenes sp. KSB-10]